MLFIAVVAYLGRAGYTDDAGDGVSFLDTVYYATVSVTTTGYGDVAPVSDGARLVNILLVTPARVLFLVLLVGTTVEILTERSRDVIRLRRWSGGLRDHVIICGYGTKGRSAIDAVHGNAASAAVLRWRRAGEARGRRARPRRRLGADHVDGARAQPQRPRSPPPFARPRTPTSAEIGRERRPSPGELLVAVVRDGETITFDDDCSRRLESGDRVVCLGVSRATMSMALAAGAGTRTKTSPRATSPEREHRPPPGGTIHPR